MKPAAVVGTNYNLSPCAPLIELSHLPSLSSTCRAALRAVGKCLRAGL